MPSLVYRINALLCHVLTSVPVGTNLGLFHLLWTLLSGRLLASRGALIPALWDTGLAAEAVRRAGAALSHGCWRCSELLGAWQQAVDAEGRWQAHSHGGYRPVAGDLVGFFRPRLRGCLTKHYASASGRALPAIVLGVLVRVGSVAGKRLPLPCAFVRATPAHQSEADLQRRLLEQAGLVLAESEKGLTDGALTQGGSGASKAESLCRAAKRGADGGMRTLFYRKLKSSKKRQSIYTSL
jgi:hypothetical protein